MTTPNETDSLANKLILDTTISVLDAHFAFKPGDVVALRETVEALKAEFEAFGHRDRYGSRPLGAQSGIVVSERLLAQCHGGVQGFYHIMERDADRKGIISRVPTHAVVPYADLVEALKALAPPRKGADPWKDAVETLAGADLVAAAEAVTGASEK